MIRNRPAVRRAVLTLMTAAFAALGTFHVAPVRVAAQTSGTHVVLPLGAAGTVFTNLDQYGIRFSRPMITTTLPPAGFAYPATNVGDVIPGAPGPALGICPVGANGQADCRLDFDMIFPNGATNVEFDVVGGYTDTFCRRTGVPINFNDDVLIQFISGFQLGNQALDMYYNWVQHAGPFWWPFQTLNRIQVFSSGRIDQCGLGSDPTGVLHPGGIAIANIEYDALPIEVVDPACDLAAHCPGTYIDPVSRDGRLVDDPQQLASAPVTRTGAVADGVTRLLLRVKTDLPVTFTIASSLIEPGVLTDRRGGGRGSTISVSPESVGGTKWAFALFHTPRDLPQGISQALVKIEIGTTPSSPFFADVHLVRPLALLVHGVWSTGQAWSGFGKFLAASGYQDCQECVADFGLIDKAPSFDPFVASVAIDEIRLRRELALRKLRRSGIAAVQVDVVAHSMGGVATRARAAQASYQSGANYFKGEFHKIITVGSPHRGTAAADWIIANRCSTTSFHLNSPSGPLPLAKTLTLEELFGLIGMPIGPAVFGFQTSGPSLDNIGATSVPSHAIVGLAPASSPIETTLNLLIRLFGTPLTVDDFLGGDSNHDTIVPQASQQGGLAASRVTTFTGITHAISPPTETDHPPVFTEILRLLTASSTSSTDFGTFTARKSTATVPTSATPCTATSLSTLSASARAGREGQLTLTAAPTSLEMLPAPGTIVRPGEVVPISFVITGGGVIDQVLFRIGDDIQVIGGAAPLAVNYTVPSNHAGRIDATVLAIGAAGDNYLGSTFLTVVPAAAMQGLAAGPADIVLDRIGRKAGIRVDATYSDGETRDVTRGSAGTLYSTASGTLAVVSVTPDGVIEARGAGTDIVSVAHGGFTTEVAVAVTATNRAPVLSPIADVTIAAGSTAALTLSASDPDGQTPRFFDARLPLFANLTDFGDGTAQLMLSPSLADVGVHSLAVAVLDDGEPAAEAGASFSITVTGPPPSGAPPSFLAYVPIVDQNRVDVIDTSTNTVIRSVAFPTCSHAPNTVVATAITPAGDRVLGISSCGEIWVIDHATGTLFPVSGNPVVERTIGFPNRIVFSADGGIAYVESSHGIEVIDMTLFSYAGLIEIVGMTGVWRFTRTAAGSTSPPAATVSPSPFALSRSSIRRHAE